MIAINRFRALIGPVKTHLSDVISSQGIFGSGPLSNQVKSSRCFSTPVTKVFQGSSKALVRDDELNVTRNTISCVNEHIKNGQEGRLFAVVHICGKQFKITPEDIIIVEGYWPPQIGDEIKLEKILLVGGLNFTLIGRPILPQDLVTVRATVIEKDLSHTKTIFYKRKRKQYQRINFFRSQFTMLRINEVSVKGKVNEHKSTSQYERVL